MLEQALENKVNYYALSWHFHGLKLLTLQIFEEFFAWTFFALDEHLDFHYDLCNFRLSKNLERFSAICQFVKKCSQTCLILEQKCLVDNFLFVLDTWSLDFLGKLSP